MAGIFIDGIAGIKKTVSTVASVTGMPARSVTVTSIALSPSLGGSGLLLNAMSSPSLLTVPAVGGASCVVLSASGGVEFAAGSCDLVQPDPTTNPVSATARATTRTSILNMLCVLRALGGSALMPFVS